MKLLLMLLITGACTTAQKGPVRKLSEKALYDWSISYTCKDVNLQDYFDPNQRLCKFWEIMDQGDYLFAESFINGMKDDNLDPKLIDLTRAHLYIRLGRIAEAKELTKNYVEDKYFKSLRVYLALDKKFETLGEYNQMELLAKIKANLNIGMTYEAWKLLKSLTQRSRDPWIQKQIQILKSNNTYSNNGGKV